MLDDILEFLKRNRVLAVLAICLAPTAGYWMLPVLIPYGHVVIYDAHMSFEFCGSAAARAGRHCAGRFQMLVGNTGRHEETVTVVWPRVDGKWSHADTVQNITADDPREGDPELDCGLAEGRYACHIDRLMPGAMLNLSLECYDCSPLQLDGVAATPVEVRSNAHVFRGDPRVNILLGRLMILADIFRT